MRADGWGRTALAVSAITLAVVGGLGLAVGLAWMAVGPTGADTPATLAPTATADRPTLTPTSRPPGPTATAPLPALPGRVAAGTHTFPLAGAAEYSAAHHDYPATDLFAACGTAFLAPADGEVSGTTTVDRWQADTNLGPERGGLAVTLVGVDGVRYYGSHLEAVAVTAGERVRSGQVLGTVGETGSAAGTGCHLHFGISPAECGPDDWFVRRGVVSPYRYLRDWAKGVDAFPAVEVRRWHRANGCPTQAGVYP